MDSREELERLLKELVEQHAEFVLAQQHAEFVLAQQHAEFVLAQHNFVTAEGLGTEFRDKMQSAENFGAEARYNIVAMFDREHDRVMALSRWLRDATQMLSEVTASIDYRMSEEK